MRYFWLSFCDPDAPHGSQFLGVAVVSVDENEIAEANAEIERKFPAHEPNAAYSWAATRKAWQMACNPGGEVGCAEVEQDAVIANDVPLFRLMQRPELEARGLVLRPD